MTNNRPAPAEPATSNGITPGPFSENCLRKAWNRQADESNQWDSLEVCEQLAVAQNLAIAADRAGRAIAADRAGRPAPAEPAGHIRDATEMVAPPAEGEVGKLVAALKGDAACIEAGQHDLCSSTADQLTRAAELLQQQADELATLRRQAGPPAEGEVGELVDFLETLGSDYDGPLPPRESITLFRAADLLQQQAAELTALRRLLVPTPPAEGEVGELARILKDVSGDYDDDSYPPSSESKQILRAAELLQEQAAELAMLRRERPND